MKQKLFLSSVFTELFIGAMLMSLGLYIYLQKQNEYTSIQMQLPKLMKEVQKIEEKNQELKYQISCFESPENLIRLIEAPIYAHLKFPFNHDVTMMQEGLAVELSTYEEASISSLSKPSVVIGAK